MPQPAGGTPALPTVMDHFASPFAGMTCISSNVVFWPPISPIHGITLIGSLAIFQEHALVHGIQAIRGIGAAIRVAHGILDRN